MSSYATVADLNGYLPAAQQVPTGEGHAAEVAEAERLLARASEQVDDAVRAEYATDTNGLPTDTTIAAALRDATVRQYEQWLEVGEENSIDGLAGTQHSVTGYSGLRAPKLGARAFQVLRQAGLTQPVALARRGFTEVVA